MNQRPMDRQSTRMFEPTERFVAETDFFCVCEMTTSSEQQRTTGFHTSLHSTKSIATVIAFSCKQHLDTD